MAIEEITLSVPQSLPDTGWHQPVESTCEAVNPDDRVVGRYRRILRERNRPAWTRRGRRRRLEAYEVAYRSLIKQLAKELTESISDRAVRPDIRTRIYASLTGMLAVATAEQRRQRIRASKLFLWGITLTGAGLASLAASLYLRV